MLGLLGNPALPSGKRPEPSSAPSRGSRAGKHREEPAGESARGSPGASELAVGEEEQMGDNGRECARATVEGREAVRKSTSQQTPACGKAVT